MDAAQRKPCYLVTAIGSLSAAAVIASLRDIPGCSIVGTNASPAAWIHASCLVDAFHQVPPASLREAFLAALLRICREHTVTHILPLTDPEVDVLSDLETVMAAEGVTLCIAPPHAIKACRDKWLAYQQCVQAGDIPVIPTWLPMDGGTDALPFPLIAKPRLGRSSEGLVRLDDARDLEHFRTKYQGQPYIIQPLLAGRVCVVDIVRQRSTGKWAAASRVELLRTSNGAGTTVQMMPAPHLCALAQRVAERLDTNGCINIEFLWPDASGKEKEPSGDSSLLMDINPRFSAGVGFSRMFGYDMVKNHLACFSSDAQTLEEFSPPLDSPIITRHYAATISR